MRYKIFCLSTLFFLLLSIAQPVSAEGNVRVYYLGPEGNVKTALDLAEFEIVRDPALADVFVFNGSIPDDPAITTRIHDGQAGLVLVLGPELDAGSVSALLGLPLE